MGVDTILKGHDLFQSLKVDEAHALSGFSSVKQFLADDIIFQYNDPATHVYMLMTGSVYLRLPANPQGFSLVISKIEKGELFGLSPLLDSERFTATAQCIKDTEVLSIEAKPFRELLRTNCPVGFNVMSLVADIYFSRYIDVLQNLQDTVSRISLVH